MGGVWAQRRSAFSRECLDSKGAKMVIWKRFGLILTVGILFLFTASLNVFAEDIKIGGGGASINTVFKPVTPHFKDATGIYLVNLQSTPVDGLKSLLEGSIDASTAAVSLENMIVGVEKQGIKVDPNSLQQTVIAKCKTVVFVHKDNPVTKLSKEQLKGIFTGKITNWKDVGGLDKDILIVWGLKSPGQNALFAKHILDGAQVTKNVLETTDYDGIKENIQSNPEAIGIDPIGFADSTVKVIETPELSSPVIIVTKGAPSPKVQKLIDFIKGEGQKYIKQ